MVGGKCALTAGQWFCFMKAPHLCAHHFPFCSFPTLRRALCCSRRKPALAPSSLANARATRTTHFLQEVIPQFYYCSNKLFFTESCVIPSLGRQRQEDHPKFKVSQAYSLRPYLQNNQTKQQNPRKRAREKGANVGATYSLGSNFTSSS